MNVTVTDPAVNTPPTVLNDNVTTAANTPATVNVLSNDSDPEGALTITSVSAPSNGTVAVNGTSIIYIPDSSYTGNDSFTYTVTDSGGLTAIGTVTVSVTAVVSNTPPVVNHDSAATAAGSSKLISVVSNDSDNGGVLTITSVGTPENGTATISGTSIRYTPASGFSGVDVFTYTVTDSGGLTGTGTAVVLVGDIQPQPVSAGGSVGVSGSDAVVVDVLSPLGYSSGDNVTLTLTTQPANGLVIINGDNTLTFIPDSGVASGQLTYKVDNGAGGIQTYTITFQTGLTGDVRPPCDIL